MTRLVDYPLKLSAIPVKPILLDVAWNYIDYPGHRQQQQQTADAGKENTRTTDVTVVPPEEKKKGEAKRGWWGFSRS